MLDEWMWVNISLCVCRLFGFVARKQGSTTDNVSHLFAEMDPDQPASAIVSFVSKMIASQKRWAVSKTWRLKKSLWLCSFFVTTEKCNCICSSVFFCSFTFKQLYVSVCAHENQHDRELVCVNSSHACTFLFGRTPEWTRGSAGWGVTVCDVGGVGVLYLKNRMRDWRCVCKCYCFYSRCFIVNLCVVKVDCKSIRRLTGQPKNLKKVVRACIVSHCQMVWRILAASSKNGTGSSCMYWFCRSIWHHYSTM